MGDTEKSTAESIREFKQGQNPNREKVQSHLAQCVECQTAFKAISEFFEPTRGGESSLGDVEVRQELQAFWPRVAADPVRRTPPVPPEPVAIRPGWRSSWLALAAGLVLCLLAGGWWWSWQRSRVMLTYWQAQANAALQNLESLKTESQQLRTTQNQLPAQATSPRDYILVVYGEGKGRRVVVDRYFLRFVPKP